MRIMRVNGEGQKVTATFALIMSHTPRIKRCGLANNIYVLYIRKGLGIMSHFSILPDVHYISALTSEVSKKCTFVPSFKKSLERVWRKIPPNRDRGKVKEYLELLGNVIRFK